MRSIPRDERYETQIRLQAPCLEDYGYSANRGMEGRLAMCGIAGWLGTISGGENYAARMRLEP